MKKFQKKDLAVLAVLLAVVLLLGGVALSVIQRYRSAGLVLSYEVPGAYDYNGKLLLPREGNSAMVFDPLGREGWTKLTLKTLDLTPFGFEGESFSYYEMELRVSNGYQTSKRTVAVATDPAYEGFWPVSTPTRLVYQAKSGVRYLIHPNEGLCYPMLAGSMEGVDPEGRDVAAFSANGSYAVGLSGALLTVYHTDPMDDSLRIVDVKTVDLSSYGEVSFGAFVSDTQAYLAVTENGTERLLALDCPTGQIAPAALEESGEYGEVLDRLFLQRLDRKGEDGKLVVAWCHRLLGAELSYVLPEGFGAMELSAVSPNGLYAAGIADGGNGEEYFVVSRDRIFSLSSVLEEGDRVEWVKFVYDNMVSVSVCDAEGALSVKTFKVCF